MREIGPHTGDPKREADSMLAYARKRLLELCPRGTAIHCIRESSRTGTNAYMRVFVISANPDERGSPYWPVNITFYVHQVTGYKIKDRYGENWLMLHGGGYNRADAIAAKLAYSLYTDESALTGHYL